MNFGHPATRLIHAQARCLSVGAFEFITQNVNSIEKVKFVERCIQPRSRPDAGPDLAQIWPRSGPDPAPIWPRSRP